MLLRTLLALAALALPPRLVAHTQASGVGA